MKLFDLYVGLGLDVSDFEKDAEAAYEKADRIGNKIGLVIGKGIGASVNMVLGLAGVTNQLAGLSKEASDTTGHIDDMAQRLGISSKAYQEWSYVFAQSGLNIDSFAGSFDNLQKVMSGFATDKQYGALDAIGVALEDIENLQVEEAFALVVSKLMSMDDAAERSGAALTMLGGSAGNLPAVLNQGAEKIEELKQEAHDLGLVLGEEVVSSGASMGDEIDKYTASLDGMKTQIGAQFLPVFTEFLSSLNQAATTFMPTFLTAIEKLSPILSNLIDSGLTLLTNALQWCVEHTDELGAMLTTAAVGFAAVQVAVNPIGTIIYGIVGATMLMIANWESVKETAIGIWNSITTAVQSAVDAIRSFLGLNEEARKTSVHVSADGVSHGGGEGRQFASGLAYVPYDNYVANLHRGETVLTRQQAEEYRAGATGGLDTSAILAKLDAVVETIASMSVTMDGQRVGDVVTARVSRNIAQTARRERRYG